MKLKNNGIFNLSTWEKFAPPMGGAKQWKEERSAMEFARYLTADYPNVPKEIEKLLLNFTDASSELDWEAEYVTDFSSCNLGRGAGRNHDAFMFNNDVVVGIEAKADEALSTQVIGEALKKASDNKRLRINGMIEMLFGDEPDNHKDIRYQLITASTAMLIEAKKRNVSNAVLIVIAFKKEGCYNGEKIQRNHSDIAVFLNEISATACGDYYLLPTPFGDENGIKLYFKYIEALLG